MNDANYWKEQAKLGRDKAKAYAEEGRAIVAKRRSAELQADKWLKQLKYDQHTAKLQTHPEHVYKWTLKQAFIRVHLELFAEHPDLDTIFLSESMLLHRLALTYIPIKDLVRLLPVVVQEENWTNIRFPVTGWADWEFDKI